MGHWALLQSFNTSQRSQCLIWEAIGKVESTLSRPQSERKRERACKPERDRGRWGSRLWIWYQQISHSGSIKTNWVTNVNSIMCLQQSTYSIDLPFFSLNIFEIYCGQMESVFILCISPVGCVSQVSGWLGVWANDIWWTLDLHAKGNSDTSWKVKFSVISEAVSPKIC